MSGYSIKPYISAEEIDQKVSQLANLISESYGDQKPIIVAVLKGSIFFLADLARELGNGFHMDFMAASSYKGKESSGNVQIRLDLATDVHGKDVLIVEDIVDTGLTLSSIIRHLETRNPKSIKVVSLLFKKDAYQGTADIDFVGFEIPNVFVVGYGMDLDGEFRNLPYIGLIVD